MALQHHRWAVCADHLNPERSTFAWKKNYSPLRRVKTACTGCLPRSRQAIHSMFSRIGPMSFAV